MPLTAAGFCNIFAKERGFMRKAILILLTIASFAAADSLNVSMLGKLVLTGSATDVVVTNGRAYLACGSGGVRIVDLADPADPVELFHHPPAGHTSGLGVSGDYLYSAEYSAGMVILDVTWPPPAELGTASLDGYSLDVFVDGYYAYVAGYSSGLRIVDVSDPYYPDEIASFDVPGFLYGTYTSGDLCLLAEMTAGVRLLDIHNPYAPTELGIYDTYGEAKSGALHDSLAFVADGLFGLRIIDFADPADPAELGHCDTPGKAVDIHLAGDYALVAAREFGLRVVDISDPGAPSEVGYYETAGEAKAVWAHENLALLACGDSGLVILDVSHFTTVEEKPFTPERLEISAAPNPFNSKVDITITGARGGNLEIRDISGRLVRRIELIGIDSLERIIWEPDAALPSGCYLAKLSGTGSTVPIFMIK